MFSDQVQSGEDEDEDYRPHWEIHWKVKNYFNFINHEHICNLKIYFVFRVLMLE